MSVLLKKIIKNLEIKQRDGCVSFQHHNVTLSNRPTQELLNSLGELYFCLTYYFVLIRACIL